MNVVANLMLIPHLGTRGAGIATLLGYGALTTILIPLVWRRVLLPWRAIATVLAGASVIGVTALATAHVPWALSAMLCLAMYSVAVVCSRPVFARVA